MQKLQLNFNYSNHCNSNSNSNINREEYVKVCPVHKSRMSQGHHSEESYINEIEKKNNLIADMEDKQEMLIKRNIELENNIFKLQEVVFKNNKGTIEDKKYKTINNFNKSNRDLEIGINNVNINDRDNNNNGNLDCYSKSKRTRNDEVAFDKEYSKTESNYNSYRTPILTKKTTGRIKNKRSFNAIKPKPMIKNMSLSRINNKKQYNISSITKASSPPTMTMSATSSIKPTKETKCQTQSQRDKRRRSNDDSHLINQIGFLQQQIKSFKEEIDLNLLESKGESFLLQELNNWKHRNTILSNTSIESIHLLNQKKLNNRQEFSNEIQNTQNYCRFIIEQLTHQCQSTLKHQSETIDFYRTNNTILKKRLGKAGNIIIGKKI